MHRGKFTVTTGLRRQPTGLSELKGEVGPEGFLSGSFVTEKDAFRKCDISSCQSLMLRHYKYFVRFMKHLHTFRKTSWIIILPHVPDR